MGLLACRSTVRCELCWGIDELEQILFASGRHHDRALHTSCVDSSIAALCSARLQDRRNSNVATNGAAKWTHRRLERRWHRRRAQERGGVEVVARGRTSRRWVRIQRIPVRSTFLRPFLAACVHVCVSARTCNMTWTDSSRTIKKERKKKKKKSSRKQTEVAAAFRCVSSPGGCDLFWVRF